MSLGGVLFFLFASLLLYVVLGGADFGAGILELVSRDSESERESDDALIGRAMGPVWEANHMWMILAVVILFVGFPRAYAQISVSFHIPITLMLFGIILRGSAFAFRHYDALEDGSRLGYRHAFAIGSLLATMSLGLVTGGLSSGRARPVTESFYQTFLYPWLNVYSLSVGLLLCCLFAYLAASFLIGEALDPPTKARFQRKAWIAQVAAVPAGGAVFLSALAEGIDLPHRFLNEPTSLACMIVATFLLWPVAFSLKRGAVRRSRMLSSLQVTLILVGWLNLQYPYYLLAAPDTETDWTFAAAAAPEVTLELLLAALVVGSFLIFPALFYLFHVFKGIGGSAGRGDA